MPAQGALAGPADAVADPAGPTITSPAADTAAEGYVTVTVTSTAPSVLIAWADELDFNRVEELYRPVIEAEATFVLSTSGYAGPTEIVAQDCRYGPDPTNPAQTTTTICDGAQTAVHVNVTNPPPVFSSGNYWGDYHEDDTAVISVEEEGGWANYGWFINGVHQPPVLGYHWFQIATSHLVDGSHTVQVAHCTELSGDLAAERLVCDMANVSDFGYLTMRRVLHPAITDVTPRTISPDHNGIADTAEVTITVETEQWVTWTLKQGSQAMSATRSDVLEAGSHTITIDGLDPDGNPLPSGDYTLVVNATTIDNSGDDAHGTTSTDMRIDLDAPRVTNVSARPSTFYPLRDGYRDTTTITASLSEATSTTRIELLRNHAVQRTLHLGDLPAGTFTRTWNGRRADGTRMPAGTYRYRFLVTDSAGNEATRVGGLVEVRAGR